METQEDSIDIAKLQRVALGLESAPSHLDLNALGTIGKLDRAPEAQQKSPSPSTAQDHARKSPSQPSPPRSPARPQNATNAIDTHSENNSNPPSTVPVPPAEKMTSADTVPSDTQVVSQSVYDEIIRKNQEAADNAQDSNLGDRATIMTLHEGDSGHLDLLSGYDHIHTEAAVNEDLHDPSSSKLGESSPMLYQPNPFPESQRFLAKTPIAAMKRVRSDGFTTGSPSASRNPLAADAGPSSGIMALSQVFRSTQAPSSPLVNGQQSDPLSDRPSPNIPIQSHPLATTLSSPYNTLAATFPRDSSAQRLSYISMEESQANREKILHERMTRSADHVYSDQSDGEFDKESSFVERMRRRKMVDDEADAQLVGLTAPARPISRQESPANTLSEAVAGPHWTDGSTAQVESGTELPHGALSEEETEQEQEDLDQPTPRARPNGPTEEDKENCEDASTTIAAAASAHDRLSQALALHESPCPREEVIRGRRESLAHTRSTLESEHLHDRSSQVSVVKDSQRSPGRRDPGNDAEQWDARHAGSQGPVEPLSDAERITSSPIKVRICSSPPSGSPRSKRSRNLDAHAASRPGSDAGSPSRSPTPRASSAHGGNMIQSSMPAVQRPTGTSDRLMLDHPEKSSSMPSRVAETPVAPRTFAEAIPNTSIPETSPTRLGQQGWPNGDSTNDAADQEDDDLPPVYMDPHERGPRSQPMVPGSSSPMKPSSFHNSKILSSPSGRQRRALTEIAADASPQMGAGHFNLDISILSADDREFRSAVAMSPIPPRKKRRGNDGQSVYASDPVFPVTPRATTPAPRVADMKTIPELEPAEATTKPVSTFQRRSRPPRAESVWDMDDTPHYHVSRKDRSRLLACSRPVGRLSAEAEREPIQEPPVHNNPPASSIPEELPSDLNVPDSTEAPVDNEPISENLPPAQLPQPSVDHGVPIAVNQVLAPWNGPKRAYYPATCFGKPFGTSQSRYLVKFEDSAPVEIPIGAVKRLEFCVGDGVKVNMENVPKVTHIISGFANKLDVSEIEQGAANGVIPMTDVYGHSAVILTPKQRKSLPGTGLTVTENRITVPISRIYLDTILWNQLKDRVFSYDSGPGVSESGLQTPDRPSTPMSPGARLSRSIRFSTGLFAGMVFAVSYGENNDAKSRVTKMILENDGRVLEGGFNELFEMPPPAPAATPTKTPGSENCYLRLTSSAADVGFACLIADKHSRRSKYMQALALNLPCLSDRWIEDCVARRQIVDWEMYLLPAGESIYLNGATKSRILTPYPATEARLSETIAGRPNLLHGQSMLLVTGRSGRTDEERRKAYLFLTYALGASRIERVPDLKTARAILSTGEGSWDWIYADDDDRASVKVMSLSSSASKKRKRSRLTESISSDDLGMDNVKIVGNEFVCQSLILGRLFA
ncbi:BRCT domain protein [Aspergillus sclerotiicarbonarius CBS 121057]|uniref:BRCT domain protein n=1 Tax=Aspergillus sclerotiicarbonarius (strain CBS 121057 / IBT 28362) TaxID=1448318 RepID=A0A319EV55_ASPSB|nr:BRCT domain protein [Aspergillus sclerotiicarbonarius CBS 121057]